MKDVLNHWFQTNRMDIGIKSSWRHPWPRKWWMLNRVTSFIPWSHNVFTASYQVDYSRNRSDQCPFGVRNAVRRGKHAARIKFSVKTRRRVYDVFSYGLITTGVWPVSERASQELVSIQRCHTDLIPALRLCRRRSDTGGLCDQGMTTGSHKSPDNSVCYTFVW